MDIDKEIDMKIKTNIEEEIKQGEEDVISKFIEQYR